YDLMSAQEARLGYGDSHGHAGVPHESPWVVTLPLILLAIPSVCAGWVIGTFVFGDYFGSSIYVAQGHDAVRKMGEEFHGVLPMILHGLTALPFWLALAGAGIAWFIYIARPELPGILRAKWGGRGPVRRGKHGCH